MQMFCYQCEQTTNGTGCVEIGVCGKDPRTAALQDLLVHAAKGVSIYAHRAATLGKRDPEVDRFVLEALFATVTNVDFDPAAAAEAPPGCGGSARPRPAALRGRLPSGGPVPREAEWPDHLAAQG